MSDIVVSVKHLSKCYKIMHEVKEPYKTLSNSIIEKFKKIVNPKNIIKKKEIELFDALNDVSLDIKKGEKVAIIGKNGAGKSTLLKILSRITEPSSGEVRIKGRIASLLEVGTGFHPELTGRENIFLNGAVLGMTKKEIEQKFDDIVDFSGCEKFLDTPVKRYSSGMRVRLGFAVAAHLESEILIVDEVLAVGDAEFQKKCLGKMDEISKGQGRTIIFVSHNMAAVKNLCNKGYVLESGRLKYVGDINKAVDFYLDRQQVVLNNLSLDMKNTNPQNIIFKSLSYTNVLNEPIPSFKVGENININIDYEIKSNANSIRVGVQIYNNVGELVTTYIESMLDVNNGELLPKYGTLRISLKNILTPGSYSLNIIEKEGRYIVNTVSGIRYEVVSVPEVGLSSIQKGYFQDFSNFKIIVKE